MSLYFYCGAECLRSLDENPAAAKRPRGYSCEELGGLAWAPSSGWELRRVSETSARYISPHATGCSRYVSTLFAEEGITAMWQLAQADGSQPLVGTHLPMTEVEAILAG